MALNFPDSPTLNQVYTDTTAGFSYKWDGSAWQSYTPTAVRNILIADDISGSFNGSTDTFSLTSDGSALIPANAQQLRVTLGGIVQRPTIDYTVSGSNITFTTPPSSPLSCSIVSFGPSVPINVIDDGSITPAKLSTGGPSWNSDGDVVITGVGSTALLVNGNARVTGILTVGTSSLTLNGDTNQINGVTISSGVVTATSFVGNLTGTASTATASGIAYDLTGTPNITVGVVTASSFSGPLSGTASTAGYATTSFGLEGTPNISVNSVSINGTSVIDSSRNINNANLFSTITGVASQVEAEAGTSSTKLMTPERVKQAIEALAGGSVIQSIQRGTISINNPNTSATATISSVNTSKAFVSYLGRSNTNNGTSNDYQNSARISLTSATQVTATREGNFQTVTVSYEVIEFV